VHVQAGQQRERALAPVLVLVADGPAGRGGQGGVPAAAGIDLRLGVEGQDPVTGAERLALVAALVQVHDDLGPGGQFRAGPPARRHPGRGRQLAGQRDHRSPVQLADPPRPARPGQVSQPTQPLR
jgi:hypothetical protein